MRTWRHTCFAHGAAAYLIAWLALLPLAQALHLRFASHDHRFCLEHQRFEDVPRFRPTEIPARTSQLRAPGKSPADGDETPCALSNATAAREQALPASSPPLPSPLPSAPRASPAPSTTAATDGLLLFAPKQSPPALLG